MDRLRRLDALFAEKVLGWDLPVICDGETMFDNHSRAWCEACGFRSPPSAVGKMGVHRWVPKPYTHSLDAAWEGAEAVTRDEHGEFDVYFAGGSGTWCVEFNWCGGSNGFGEAPHPAEALVLACLRAVGCTEDELA